MSPDVARWLPLWGLLLITAGALSVTARVGAEPAGPVVESLAAGSESVAAGTTVAAEELDDRDAYRLALLRMKGYLSVARALLQLRAPGADHYMQELLQEVFRDTEAELERRSAPFTADFLQQLKAASGADPVATLATIESAVFAIDGSFAQTGAMDAESVLALSEALLREAVAKYADAVSDNEVVDLGKYQSGRGFVTEAEALVRYAGALKGQPAHAELVKSVTLIRQAWPGVVPPPIVFDPARVEGRLDEAVAAMDKLR